MKISNRVTVWAIPAAVLLFSCSSLSEVSGMLSTVEALATPDASGVSNTAPASTADSSGTILFEDDFSDDSKGWGAVTDEYGTTGFSDGAYIISVADSMSYLLADPDTAGTYTDVSIEVDILASDETPHDMGVICRYQDDDNFYYLIISSDGYYAVGKFKDGEDLLVELDEMPADENGVIQTGMAANHLRADCVGDTLTLYANGKQLLEVQDSDFSEGGVGLIAGSYDDAPIIVLFDNFIVKKA
ncbi:MAG: hypothetical protein WBM17_05815 [Anaerolineales bacterium]